MGVFTHRSALVRVGATWAVGLVAFVAAWALSRGLPGGAIASVSVASRIPFEQAPGAPQLAAGIFLWNLFFGAGAIFLASLFTLGRFPLGYLGPWLWFAVYGVVLGTNSFAIRGGGPADLLGTAWSGAGVRELTAYLLVAAAFANVHLWRQRSLADWRLERVRRWADVRLSSRESACLALGLVLLASAALTEAGQIVEAVGVATIH